jgi:hypothetical protein
VVSNARLVLDAQCRIADIPEKTELPAMLTWADTATPTSNWRG